MNPHNDEVVARLQATLRAVADRTPIGEARSIEYANLPTAGQRPRTAVTVLSAAAAVAAIAAVTAVVASNHQTAGRSVVPGAGGVAGPASSASAAPDSDAVPTPTPATLPTPVRSVTVGSAVPQASPTCVPENYYVVASPAQLAGLTYLLPSTPSGYTFYGAWGTIAANNCAGSQTWYVEYDQSPDATTNISISVRPTSTQAQPEAAVATTVQGHPAWVLDKDATYGVVVWEADGLDFQVSGPTKGGSDALVAVANSLTAVSANDPRIVAPLNCRIAPGNTCPENPPASVSPTPSPSPTN